MNVSDLAVCTMIENPLKWKARYKNFENFTEMLKRFGVKLYIAEVLYKDQQSIVLNDWNDGFYHMTLRTNCEIWHKEQALNLLMTRVKEPLVCWMDADVEFTNLNWPKETVELLQFYDVIQMFSSMIDLGSNYHPSSPPKNGFMYEWKTNGRTIPKGRDVRTGNAWAARKESLSKVGMLIDWGIVGCGDHHMASALVGNVNHSLTGMTNNTYVEKCCRWQDLAEEHIKENVSYLPGLLIHHYHGETVNRKYLSKLGALNDTGYDPDVHLVRSASGLYELRDNNPELRDFLKDFFRQRNDDGTEPDKIFA